MDDLDDRGDGLVAASRIAFAIGDLMTAIRALRVNPDSDVPPSLVLDGPDYQAVVAEIENQYGNTLMPDPSVGAGLVKFAGLQIVCLPPDEPHAA